jgi:gliding-associated putative ABC transporter substrate-binding component GldG
MNRLLSILLIAGILILLNLLSKQFFFRWDITEDKQYTLSKATKDVLSTLDEPVSVKAYYSNNLPADFEKVRNDFQDMLIEYNNLSKGNLDYEFVDPVNDPTLEQEALQVGIRPILINVREKDQASQQKAFMGAVMKLGEQQEIIPFIGPDSPMEYALTTGIKKMAVVDKPSIGFIQGHGEPGLSQLGQAFQALSIIYSVENIDLGVEASIPDRFKAVALIKPNDTIPPQNLAKLDDYLSRGGKLLIAFDAVTGDFSTSQGTGIESSLIGWLAGKGLEVEKNFIVDASSGAVTVQQRQGFFTMNTQVQFPFLPIIKKFGEHPVTKGLEQVIFQFASPLRYSGDSTTYFTPLVTSSEKAGIITAPTFFNIEKKWNNADFPLSNITIGGVLEGSIDGGLPSKLIVITDGDFAVSGEQGRGINQDNINLLVNAIEWMSDDTGLSELRTKGVLSRPIDEIEDGKRNLLKYLNFFLPILLAIGYGIFRFQRNRNKRMRRMQERYV